MNGKFFLYFYYDQADTLLYIGKATDVWSRWIGHRESWKKDVCKIGVYECSDPAAMDVLEHFYIAKIPTLYNIAGLTHGYTGLEIPNLEKPIIYTVDEFKEHFQPKNTTNRKEPLAPIDDRIRAMGNTIVEINGTVDLYDEALLNLDLDRVYFKYGDLYLISKYSTKPGDRVRKKDQLLSHRTNACIRAIKNYLNNPTLTVNTCDGTIFHSFKITDATKDDCKHQLGLLDGHLYSLYEASSDWRGVRLNHVGGLYPQTNILLGRSTILGELEPDGWSIMLDFAKEQHQAEQPQISDSEFFYDMTQLHREIIENNNRRRTANV